MGETPETTCQRTERMPQMLNLLENKKDSITFFSVLKMSIERQLSVSLKDFSNFITTLSCRMTYFEVVSPRVIQVLQNQISKRNKSLYGLIGIF